MNRKLLGILVIVSGILILVGVVYVVFLGKNPLDIFSKKTVEPTVEVATTTEETKVNKGKSAAMEAVIRERKAPSGDEIPTEEAIKRNEVRSFNKEDLTRLASSFAERFGSYSNHSNFSNVIDLKVFMTEKMQRWADSYVAEQRKKNLSDAMYYGVTAKAIEKEVKEFDDNVGVASVLVTTRRREYSGSTINLSNTFNQAILIKFINENGAWKVDSATWQDR